MYQAAKKPKKTPTFHEERKGANLSLITLGFLGMKINIPPIYTMRDKLRIYALSLKFSLLCQKAIHSFAENKLLNLGYKSLFDKAISSFIKVLYYCDGSSYEVLSSKQYTTGFI